MVLFDVISHAKLFFIFFTDQPRNPWHMPEPWLKMTAILCRVGCQTLLTHSFTRKLSMCGLYKAQCFTYKMSRLASDHISDDKIGTFVSNFKSPYRHFCIFEGSY